MEGRIFFLGNALFDISARCSDSILREYKLKPDENTEATDIHNQLFDFLLENPDSVHSPGGSAQNSARIAQWVFKSYGIGQASFVGCIGDDDYGKKLQHFLSLSGVKTIYDVHATVPTGVTAALITSDDKRSLCARLGASSLFNKAFLSSPMVTNVLNSCDVIYVEGYFLSHSPLCALDLAYLSHNMDKIFAINLSAPYISVNCFSDMKRIISMSEIVFGNASEAKAFADECGIIYSSVEDCVLAIASLLKTGGRYRTAVITQGPDPLIIASSITNNVKSYKVETIDDIKDTIGCGDALAGGFLSALSLGKSVETSAECGIYCAMEIARCNGCMIPEYELKYKL